MKERPILMSAEMVRAVLAGTKTQTRRALKVQPSRPFFHLECSAGIWRDEEITVGRCPFGEPGDRLWVKETWAAQNLRLRTVKPVEIPEDQRINYAAGHTADDLDGLGPWRPSLFMRRWMSRITLEIVAVRVERLRAITEADAKAEGVTPSSRNHQAAALAYIFGATEFLAHTSAFATVWESIYGRGSWEINPWVWVIEFRKVAA